MAVAGENWWLPIGWVGFSVGVVDALCVRVEVCWERGCCGMWALWLGVLCYGVTVLGHLVGVWLDLVVGMVLGFWISGILFFFVGWWVRVCVGFLVVFGFVVSCLVFGAFAVEPLSLGAALCPLVAIGRSGLCHSAICYVFGCD